MSGASRRQYHSPRREEAARETRRAVLEAAREEFVRRGYAGASLASIARAAGVSLATVKLVEGTKSRLLLAAIQAVLRGGEPATPLVEQPWWREMLAEPDPRRLLSRFTVAAASALEIQGPLFEVVWQAAASEPELAELDQRARRGRWQNQHQIAETLAERGALRAGLDVEAATDTIWALASPQLYRLMVTGRGWSTERWQAWLLDSLTRQLLPSDAPNEASED